MLGAHLGQKRPLPPPYNPKIFAKCDQGGPKIGQKFCFATPCQQGDNLLAKYIPTRRMQKNDLIFFLYGGTAARSWNWCAVQFSHCSMMTVL